MIRPGCSCAHIRSQNRSSIESNNIAQRDITTALPRRFANCRPSPELLKSWTPNLISGLIIIAMPERKYSGAEHLIVKLQKESQALKCETDGKPP
jgi:hypothetical protein